MRYVDRQSFNPPSELSSPFFKRMRLEYLDFLSLHPKQRAQTRPPNRHLPPRVEILLPLSLLFDGKCAFCESNAPLNPYRFRPTAEALPIEGGPDANLYYGWLADAWQNLYPICAKCRPRRPNYFPISGPRAPIPTVEEYEAYCKAGDGLWRGAVDDTSILLDPCEPFELLDHLHPDLNGMILPLSSRGEETLKTFDLNRHELVMRRREAFDQHVRESADRRSVLSPEREFAGLIAALAATLRTTPGTVPAESPRETKPTATDPARRPRAAKRKRQAPLPASKRRKRRAPSPAAALEKQQDAPPQWTLTSITIEAFKSLEKVQIEMPSRGATGQKPALLILGENATGKSSLLEAVALAMSTDEARKALEENPAAILLNPHYLGDQKQKQRRRGEVVLTFTDDTGHSLRRSLTLGPQAFKTEGELPKEFPVFGYGAYRHYRDDFHQWQPHRSIISLFRSDNLLSNPQHWLLTLSPERFNMVIRALRDIFGGGFRNIEKKNNECLVVIEREKDPLDETKDLLNYIPLSSVSSGFRTILALTCDVMRWLMERDPDFVTLTMAQGLILIDEVEAHLHPRWKVAIMDGLRRALPNMTFIVTTHDPLCIRGMQDGEVIVLQRIAGKAVGSALPITIETLTGLPDVTKLTVEQLLSSDLFSLFDTDDPVAGQAMADLADALALQGSEAFDDKTRQLLKKFRTEIDESLPVGSTEVSRLVQEVVAEYLVDRRKRPSAGRMQLRDDTKQRIRRILEQN